jgi:hypothetical protein
MNRALYLIAEWLLGRLPVDLAGRRVFDETLADWRKESAKASGLYCSSIVAIRAVGSVLRSVAGVSFREIRSLPRGAVLIRMCLWMTAFLIVVALRSQISANAASVSVSSEGYAYVGRALYFLPVSLFLATALGRDRRSVSGLGLALVSVVVAVPMMGWALPAANSVFLEANRGRYTNPKTPEEAAWRAPRRSGDGLTMSTMGDVAIVPITPNLFMNDLTISQLGVRIARGPGANGWAAIRWLSFFGAYLVICALAPVLAMTLRRRAAYLRYAIVLVTAVVLFKPPVLSRLGGEFSVAVWLGTFWIPVLWMSLCVLLTARREPEIQIRNNQ